MTGKIFRSILVIAAVVLLCALVIVMGVFYSYAGNVQTAQLKDELSLAAAGVENYGESYLQTMKPGDYRITWIAADGTVLEELPLEVYQSFSPLFGADLYAAIDLDACVEKRVSRGGTSVASVEEQLRWVREQL